MKKTYNQLVDRFLDNKASTKSFILKIIISLLYWAVMVALPYNFNKTFTTAYIATIISIFMFIFFYMVLVTVNERYKVHKSIIILLKALLISYIALAVLVIFPFININPTPNGNLEATKTYVTFEKDCPYCEISKINMRRAVKVYNKTHDKTISVINLSSNKPISKEVKKYIKYKGSIVHVNKDGNVTSTKYTKGNEHGPIEPTNSEIYNLLTEINR